MEVPDNFLGIEEEYSNYKNAKVVVLPVAYEGTATYGKGASKGPKAIIEASKQVELYDSETGRNAYDIGIFTLGELKTKETSEKMIEAVYLAVKKEISSNKFVAMLGGEHSITAGAVKAFKEKFPDLSVLHIDAHADLREEYEGSKYNHACVMMRIFEMKVPFVQVGIRSLCDEEAEFIRNKKIKTFFAHDIHAGRKWIGDAISSLSKNVYITFDVDCLDPSIMPATGTPEPGGLGWYDALELLKTAAGSKNIVGFDIVELAPIKGLHFPDFTAAKLASKIIGYCFLNLR